MAGFKGLAFLRTFHSPSPATLMPVLSHQKMQRPLPTAIGHVDQGRLAPAERAEVRHIPVQTDQTQRAIDDAGRLAKRHAEQHRHRRTGLDGGLAVGLMSAMPARRRTIPGHLGIEPDRQRAAELERFAVGRSLPVL